MLGQAIDADALFKKISWRVIPLLFVGFFIAFLDRINIGFVQLQMGAQLDIDPAAFGFAAGAFFLTYSLFELPSNLLFVRLGARKTFFRIMILWGVTVVLTAFVSNKYQLYAMRGLLGLCEAGFLPGAILYLTYWFPSSQRARSTSLFLSSIFFASLFVGPASGAIMTYMDGWLGLHGWQWVFIVQGLPACFMGVVFLFVLDDHPKDAKWLSAAEKTELEGLKQQDIVVDHSKFSKAQQLKLLLGDRNLYVFVAVYFPGACANYFMNFWLPTILKAASSGTLLQVGWLTAIPHAVGIVGMLAINWSSDRLGDRKWHLILCYTVCAASLLFANLAGGSLIGVLIGMSGAAFFLYAVGSLFWTLPATYFSPTTAVLGLSIVAGLSNTAGFFSPYVVGILKFTFGTFDYAVYGIALLLGFAILMLLVAIPAQALRVGLKRTPEPQQENLRAASAQ
jgi:sugar phosphate permease